MAPFEVDGIVYLPPQPHSYNERVYTRAMMQEILDPKWLEWQIIQHNDTVDAEGFCNCIPGEQPVHGMLTLRSYEDLEYDPEIRLEAV